MTDTGSRLDAARARVVERGLTPVAVEQLTPVVADLPIESLGPVKQLLKRFFSDGPWTDDDDAALAEIVSSDVGVHRHELEPGLTLTWGTESGRFRLWVESDAGDDESSRPRGHGCRPGSRRRVDVRVGGGSRGDTQPQDDPVRDPADPRRREPELRVGGGGC